MTRDDFKKLSEARLTDAKVLPAARRFDAELIKVAKLSAQLKKETESDPALETNRGLQRLRRYW